MSGHPRVVLVTGAAKGIGAACARRFAAEGAAVALVDRDEGALQELTAGLQAGGAEALPLVADVCRRAQVDAAVSRAVTALGRLDVLVNNAGVAFAAPVDGHQDEDWDRLLAVNLSSAFYFVRAALPEAEILAGQWEISAATEKAQRAVTIDPNFTMAYQRLAFLQSLSDWPPARQTIATALGLSRRRPLPLARKRLIEAWGFGLDMRVDEAIRVLEQAVTEAPEALELQFDLALFYWRAGRFDDATRAATVLVDREPTSSHAVLYRSYYQAWAGDLAGALASLERSFGRLVGGEAAGPPHVAAEVEREGGDEDRADDERVEQDAEGDDEVQFGQRDERQDTEVAEGRRQDEAGRGDDATGTGEGYSHALSEAAARHLLPDPAGEQDVVVDPQRDEEDQRVHHRAQGRQCARGLLRGRERERHSRPPLPARLRRSGIPPPDPLTRMFRTRWDGQQRRPSTRR